MKIFRKCCCIKFQDYLYLYDDCDNNNNDNNDKDNVFYKAHNITRALREIIIPLKSI